MEGRNVSFPPVQVQKDRRGAGNGFENKTFTIAGFSEVGTLTFFVRSKTSTPTEEGIGEGGGGEGGCLRS